jgi:uncharacterized protein YndB with AHSA1/START domain
VITPRLFADNNKRRKTMIAKLRGARSVADVGDGLVLGSVEIAAGPERVFRALTTSELTTWWGADGVYRTTSFTMDPRPGGAWHTDGVGADGTNFRVEGQVLDIEPPRRLVYSWKPSWDEGPPTRVAYSLTTIDGGTRVALRHTGFDGRPESCGMHGQGWEQVLGWLAAYLSPASTRRAFLCRLLPPRATFIQDMTSEERTLMDQHGRYWRAKLGEGPVVAFGPVGDPAGGWGLGILEAQDEAELKHFLAADPAVASIPGFRYELLPILRLIR